MHGAQSSPYLEDAWQPSVPCCALLATSVSSSSKARRASAAKSCAHAKGPRTCDHLSETYLPSKTSSKFAMALYWPDHAQCGETDLDMLRHAHIQGPSAHVDINNICVAALCTLRALLARTAHSHGENVSGVWVRGLSRFSCCGAAHTRPQHLWSLTATPECTIRLQRLHLRCRAVVLLPADAVSVSQVHADGSTRAVAWWLLPDLHTPRGSLPCGPYGQPGRAAICKHGRNSHSAPS